MLLPKSRRRLEGPTRLETKLHAHLCHIHLDCLEQLVQLSSRSGGTRRIIAFRRYLLATLLVSLASSFEVAQHGWIYIARICIFEISRSPSLTTNSDITHFVMFCFSGYPIPLDRDCCVLCHCQLLFLVVRFSTDTPLGKSCPYEKRYPPKAVLLDERKKRNIGGRVSLLVLPLPAWCWKYPLEFVWSTFLF